MTREKNFLENLAANDVAYVKQKEKEAELRVKFDNDYSP